MLSENLLSEKKTLKSDRENCSVSDQEKYEQESEEKASHDKETALCSVRKEGLVSDQKRKGKSCQRAPHL